MTVTALPLQPPEPEKDADESGMRFFFPSDDHEYDLEYLGRFFLRQAGLRVIAVDRISDIPQQRVVLDDAGWLDNGLQFVFEPAPSDPAA